MVRPRAPSFATRDTTLLRFGESTVSPPRAICQWLHGRFRHTPLVGELSHVGEAGDVRMVDVGGKPLSRRRAVAAATVRMAPDTARRLRELPKGDALATAQLAGIMAAKRTAELIPLCHPLPLSHVEVALEVGDDAVEIRASAETTAQTGVEMEALVAASVAALTVYDMAKAVDKEMTVEGVRLLEKTKEAVA
jgi:cyclic pyranopterin monophosphate synthase